MRIKSIKLAFLSVLFAVYLPMAMANDYQDKTLCESFEGEGNCCEATDGSWHRCSCSITSSCSMNSQNSKNWVGTAHNRGVQYVLDQLKAQRITKEVIGQLANKYVGNNVVVVWPVIGRNAVLNQLLLKGKITRNSIYFYKELFAIADAAGIDNSVEFYAKIGKLEAQAATSLNERELLTFYNSSAIARYSGQFWANAINDGTILPGKPWQDIVAADVFGCIVGGVTGGLAGCIGFGIAFSVIAAI